MEPINPDAGPRNWLGIGFTLLVTLIFLWIAWQFLHLFDSPAPLTPSDIQSNECQAFQRLKDIAAAQEKYRQTDWDGDGKRTYASFYVHLWRSISSANLPVTVNLIPQKLAFAMEAGAAIDGYYFQDFHQRREANGSIRPLHEEREWALIAIPAQKDRTGRLTFIIDQQNHLFATNNIYPEKEFPFASGRNGWTQIESIADLNKLQQRI